VRCHRDPPRNCDGLGPSYLGPVLRRAAVLVFGVRVRPGGQKHFGNVWMAEPSRLVQRGHPTPIVGGCRGLPID
jgi:hypothetical protein